MARVTSKKEPRTPENIAADLLAEAGQEGCDGEMYDLMQEAGECIRKLSDALKSAKLLASQIREENIRLVANFAAADKNLMILENELKEFI